jgi:hypothetical protein
LQALVVLITACEFFADQEEITRVPSPDRLVDMSWQSGHHVFTADRYEDLQLAWRDVRQLELCFDSARVFHFTNFSLVLLFRLVASGQVKLRRIDGWRKIAAVFSQHTAVAA